MPEDSDTPQLDPATFDLDAWLEGVQRIRAVKTLYARADLMPRIDEIVAELGPLVDRLDKAKLADDPATANESLADAGRQAREDLERRDVLRAELTELWATYESSGADFELTQMASDDYDGIVEAVEKAHPDPAFDAPELEQQKVAAARNELAARLIVLGTVTAVGAHGKPRTPTTLTEERLKKITARFGVDQVGELIGQARSLTLESRVDVPFSQRVSEVLDASTSG